MRMERDQWTTSPSTQKIILEVHVASKKSHKRVYVLI